MESWREGRAGGNKLQRREAERPHRKKGGRAEVRAAGGAATHRGMRRAPPAKQRNHSHEQQEAEACEVRAAAQRARRRRRGPGNHDRELRRHGAGRRFLLWAEDRCFTTRCQHSYGKICTWLLFYLCDPPLPAIPSPWPAHERPRGRGHQVVVGRAARAPAPARRQAAPGSAWTRLAIKASRRLNSWTMRKDSSLKLS